ncbi:hypothetical protein P691DRAFT_757176 [Macrolepiota fuliginosa MF-IS2]|uniref:Uncharacterized protein n=1 Tax=Macrolepiota fuliginosa MF-IS2 TaxID=1400762 RepID=A0A9P6C775_9AGAR|nr:hypothetical protein P691DRAFT_757176 [Macrolepiota fuliginosa MF-IS2]
MSPLLSLALTRRAQEDTGRLFSQLVTSFALAGLIELLLYGMHLVLFFIYLHLVLLNRQATPKLIFGAIVLLFLSCTIDVAFTLDSIVNRLPPAVEQTDLAALLPPDRVNPKNLIFVTNNFIADFLLLYRCWMVWGSSYKYWVMFIGLFIVAETGVGLYHAISLGTTISVVGRFYTWAILAINILLTSATAGRIWWISRAYRSALGKRHVQVYRQAVVILLGSGSIYPLGMIIYLALLGFFPLVKYVLVAIPIRLVGIAPTMMIVQVGLNKFTKQEPDTLTEKDGDNGSYDEGYEPQRTGSQRSTN